jgi:hypothetical protein
MRHIILLEDNTAKKLLFYTSYLMKCKVSWQLKRTGHMVEPSLSSTAVRARQHYFWTLGPKRVLLSEEKTAHLAASMNGFVRKELKYETDLPYEVLSLKVNREWNWGFAAQE